MKLITLVFILSLCIEHSLTKEKSRLMLFVYSQDTLHLFISIWFHNFMSEVIILLFVWMVVSLNPCASVFKNFLKGSGLWNRQNKIILTRLLSPLKMKSNLRTEVKVLESINLYIQKNILLKKQNKSNHNKIKNIAFI